MDVMPATSQVQQSAAGAALAAKRGEKSSDELYGAAKDMYNGMSATQLSHFAGTKRKGLPHKKALVGMNTQGTTNSSGYPSPKACMSMEDAGRAIVSQLLSEEGPVFEDDEQAEVTAAKNILSALARLQASLPQATPEQKHDITAIRAAANNLIRSHETESPNEPMNWGTLFKSFDPNS